MRIEVTRAHIESGHRGNAKCCPIALAMQSAGLLQTAAYEHELHWAILRPGYALPEYHSISTTPEIKLAIQGFDCDLGMEPFSFELG